jgi:neutral ceramidase
MQSADYFGEAATLAEGKHPGAVVALAAGSIGDADPLPPGLTLDQLLARRAHHHQNLELISKQAKALSTGLLDAIDEAKRRPATLRSLTTRYLEDQIAGAKVEDVELPLLPQIGIPTLAGSELGTGDIRVGILIHMREGVRRRTPDDPRELHWPRSRSNWDDREALWPQRAAGAFGAWVAFCTTRPFLDQQHRRLPLRYLELDLGERKVSILGLPGEPTTWLASKLAALCTPSAHTIVTGVTGDYVGYLTTAAEYASQQYEGGSTIWGRHTERWLAAQVRRLAGGEGTTVPAGQAEFTVLRESWTTRITGGSGTMTRR